MSSAFNIYNKVGFFFGWRNIPMHSTEGVFFGFEGLTRPVLTDAIEALKANAAYLNFENDSKENRDFWFEEAYKDLLNSGKTGGAAKSGFIKWFNWLYVAAAGDKDIKDYFGGKPYSFTEYITDLIYDKAGDVSETIEYGLKQPSAIPDLLIPTKANFWKWLIIGGAAYFVLKKL